MLNSLADFYDEEIETEVGRFVTVIEPALLVIMGIVIAGDRAGALHAALPAHLGARNPLMNVTQSSRRRRSLDPESLIDEPVESAESAGAARRAAPRGRRARRLAERYRLDFLDMNEFRIDQELFRSIPADLMLRYGFVP